MKNPGLWAALVIATAATSVDVRAGADMGSPDDVHDEGPNFFGFVKDSRGAPVGDAKVVAEVKKLNVSLITRTTAAGLYRFTGFSKQTKPEDVVISCSKEGYKQTRVLRRPVAKADPPKVETECRLERG